MLALLNEAGKAGNILGKQNDAPAQTPRKTITTATGNMNKPKMDESLIRILVDAGVIDVVEPFWFSEFHEVRNVFAFVFMRPKSCLTNPAFRRKRVLQSRSLFFAARRRTTHGFRIGVDT